MSIIDSLIAGQAAVNKTSQQGAEYATGAWNGVISKMKMDAASKDLTKLITDTPPDQEIKGSSVMEIATKYAMDQKEMGELFGQMKASGEMDTMAMTRKSARFDLQRKEAGPGLAKSLNAATDPKTGKVDLSKISPDDMAYLTPEEQNRINETNLKAEQVEQGKMFAAPAGSWVFKDGVLQYKVPQNINYSSSADAILAKQVAAEDKAAKEITTLMQIPTKLVAGQTIDKAMALTYGIAPGSIVTPQMIAGIKNLVDASVDGIVSRHPTLAPQVAAMRTGLNAPTTPPPAAPAYDPVQATKVLAGQKPGDYYIDKAKTIKVQWDGKAIK